MGITSVRPASLKGTTALVLTAALAMSTTACAYPTPQDGARHAQLSLRRRVKLPRFVHAVAQRELVPWCTTPTVEATATASREDVEATTAHDHSPGRWTSCRHHGPLARIYCQWPHRLSRCQENAALTQREAGSASVLSYVKCAAAFQPSVSGPASLTCSTNRPNRLDPRPRGPHACRS